MRNTMKDHISTRTIVLIIATIIVAPVFVYIIISLSSEAIHPIHQNNSWIGFWGAYLGAMVTGFITIFVLNSTLRQNNKNHHDLMNLQINSDKFGYQQKWLDLLKRYLTESGKLINDNTFSEVFGSIYGEDEKSEELLEEKRIQLDNIRFLQAQLFPNEMEDIEKAFINNDNEYLDALEIFMKVSRNFDSALRIASLPDDDQDKKYGTQELQFLRKSKRIEMLKRSIETSFETDSKLYDKWEIILKEAFEEDFPTFLEVFDQFYLDAFQYNIQVILFCVLERKDMVDKLIKYETRKLDNFHERVNNRIQTEYVYIDEDGNYLDEEEYDEKFYS